jgi:hypothetical protein
MPLRRSAPAAPRATSIGAAVPPIVLLVHISVTTISHRVCRTEGAGMDTVDDWSCQAIANAETVSRNAARLGRSVHPCLCKTPGQDRLAALLLLVSSRRLRPRSRDARSSCGASVWGLDTDTLAITRDRGSDDVVRPSLFYGM